MGSLDVDSLFTNNPPKETINKCMQLIYNQNVIVDDLSKSEVMELLFLGTNKSYFIFN